MDQAPRFLGQRDALAVEQVEESHPKAGQFVQHFVQRIALFEPLLGVLVSVG